MEPISDNTQPDAPPTKQRCRHSPAFKAEVLAECAQPGASVAGVAQRYHVNANLVHKWRRAVQAHDTVTDSKPGFLPLSIPTPVVSDACVTLIVGELTVHWPISHIQQALPWIKSLQS